MSPTILAVTEAETLEDENARLRQALNDIQAQAALLHLRAERRGDTATASGLHLVSCLAEEALAA